VLAPALINGPDPVGDAAMCLQPGRTLPSALMGGRGGSAQSKVDAGTLVGVLEMWIKDEPSRPTAMSAQVANTWPRRQLDQAR
jgi:hypothetical protein